MLGQSDKTSAGCLWILLSLVSLCALVPAGSLITLVIRALVRGQELPPGFVSGMGAVTVIAAWLPFGMLSYFQTGRNGWYGRVTKRLVARLPHHEGRIRSPISLLPGLRPKLGRPGVLFCVPLRLVVVSRGWRVWLVFTGLGLMGVVMIGGGGGVLLTQAFWFIPFVTYATARKLVMQEVYYDEIQEVTVENRTCRIAVAGGPLHPLVEFIATDPEKAAVTAEALRAAMSSRPETGGPIEATDATQADLQALERHAED